MQPFALTPMFVPQNITFVVAVNDCEILERNFLQSPCFLDVPQHQVIVQRGFASATQAYNEALARCESDIVVFVHQDVYLPRPWIAQLERALAQLEVSDPHWGVLGSYGITQNGKYQGCVYSSAQALHGKPFDGPRQVQTLDEIVLIMRRSSGMQFDSDLRHFHFYGTDICLEAAKRGMKNYAIFAPCIHNTRQYLVLPSEFYECSEHVRRRWAASLPIQTTCVRLTRFNWKLRTRRLQELYLRFIQRRTVAGKRVQNVHTLVEGFKEAMKTFDSHEQTFATAVNTVQNRA